MEKGGSLKVPIQLVGQSWVNHWSHPTTSSNKVTPGRIPLGEIGARGKAAAPTAKVTNFKSKGPCQCGSLIFAPGRATTGRLGGLCVYQVGWAESQLSSQM